MGNTQCIPGHRVTIFPALARKVTEVLVTQGDMVKKGQALVRLHDGKARAQVQARKVKLENVAAELCETRNYLTYLENLHEVIPDRQLHETRKLILTLEKEYDAANADLGVALAELQQHVVTAPIDGVVNELVVNPGAISKPGEAWGEILDIKEIDVRVSMPRHHADAMKVRAAAEVLQVDGSKSYGRGKVVHVGTEPGRQDRKAFALVRLANPEGKLRCNVSVQVRFLPAQEKLEEVQP